MGDHFWLGLFGCIAGTGWVAGLAWGHWQTSRELKRERRDMQSRDPHG